MSKSWDIQEKYCDKIQVPCGQRSGYRIKIKRKGDEPWEK